ncbi:uncharacterized protein LOC127081336 [Lathyrus oleraceus]|uniref:uncharacterized protein LOC127081336 n=1 Tax=Pisum sativum TaxID=3888 RepID=UPI0021CFF5BF|nr:uncharacterized protein LOC127081336 [Pisum sativum]
MDPIKYILEKLALTGRVARWQMALTEYDIQHVTQKAIKGSVLSNYLAHQPFEDYQSMCFDFPDEDIMLIRDCNIPDPEEGPKPRSRWTLEFDGAFNLHGNGIEAVITSPTGFHLPFTERLYFEYTNNMAEYKAFYGDSALVIIQDKWDWEARDHKLIPYKERVLKLILYLDEITFHHIPRKENQLVDAKENISPMFKVEWKNEAPSFHLDYFDETAYCLAAEDGVDGHPWYNDITRFLGSQEYPENASITDKMYLCKLSTKFFLSGWVLCKRNYDSILLRCVNK